MSITLPDAGVETVEFAMAYGNTRETVSIRILKDDCTQDTFLSEDG